MEVIRQQLNPNVNQMHSRVDRRQGRLFSHMVLFCIWYWWIIQMTLVLTNKQTNIVRNITSLAEVIKQPTIPKTGTNTPALFRCGSSQLWADVTCRYYTLEKKTMWIGDKRSHMLKHVCLCIQYTVGTPTEWCTFLQGKKIVRDHNHEKHKLTWQAWLTVYSVSELSFFTS